MKKCLILILLALVCRMALASNPSWAAFDTNLFTLNPSSPLPSGYIAPNTNVIATRAWVTDNVQGGTNIVENPYTTNSAANANAYSTNNVADYKGAAHDATNGLGSAAFKNISFFDLAGAATAATNGYPWSVLYDTNGAANDASNQLITVIGALPYTLSLSSTNGIFTPTVTGGGQTNWTFTITNLAAMTVATNSVTTNTAALLLAATNTVTTNLLAQIASTNAATLTAVTNLNTFTTNATTSLSNLVATAQGTANTAFSVAANALTSATTANAAVISTNTAILAALTAATNGLGSAAFASKGSFVASTNGIADGLTRTIASTNLAITQAALGTTNVEAINSSGVEIAVPFADFSGGTVTGATLAFPNNNLTGMVATANGSIGLTIGLTNTPTLNGTQTFTGANSFTNAGNNITATINAITNTALPVSIQRGTNTFYFSSFTNAALNWQSGDTVTLPPLSTNLIVDGISGTIQLVPNLTIRGTVMGGANSSVILYDTNAFILTNNVTFQNVTILSTNLSAPSDLNQDTFFMFMLAGTYDTNINFINVVLNDKNLTFVTTNTPVVGMTLNESTVVSGIRSLIKISGNISSSSSVTLENSTAEAVWNTASNNIIAWVSFDGNNYLQNDVFAIDMQGYEPPGTTTPEEIFFYANVGTNYFSNILFHYFNTNNFFSGSIITPIYGVYSAGGQIYRDASIPQSMIFYDNSPAYILDGNGYQLGNDWTKLGGNELIFTNSPSFSINNGLAYSVPGGGSMYFTTNLNLFGNSSSIVESNNFFNHFAGIYPSIVFTNFNFLPEGLTNNIVITNNDGLGLMIYSTNAAGLIVTNYGNGNIIACDSSSPDTLWVTNVGGPITLGIFGWGLATSLTSFNLCAGGKVTENYQAGTGAGTISDMFNPADAQTGYWDSASTNFLNFTIKTTTLGIVNPALAWLWCAPAIAGSMGKVIQINTTSSVTTNIQFTDDGVVTPTTNTLYFTNGILMKVTSP